MEFQTKLSNSQDANVLQLGVRVAFLVALWHISLSFLAPPQFRQTFSAKAVAQEQTVVSQPLLVENSSPSDSAIHVPSIDVPSIEVPFRFTSATVLSSSVPDMATYLAQSVFTARTNLQPSQIPNPSSTRSSLDLSMSRLKNFLSTAKDRRTDNWLAFLRWNELQDQLSRPNPDPDVLVQLERNMRQNYRGLEMPVFTEVRARLQDHIRAVRFGVEPNTTIMSLERRLDQLATSLQTPASGSDTERQREIGFALSFLNQSGQASSLVQNIQSAFGRPNLRVLVSNEFLSRQFVRPVSQSNPVNENILGTQIYGTSYMNGQVNPLLIDNPNQASLKLLLNANFSSNNIGTNRGVKVRTQGRAIVTASESISLTDSGLVSNNDTFVRAPLQSDITSIEHRSRIVRAIATNKAADQKPQANAIGQGRLESKIRTQFHDQLTQQLAESNSRIRSPDFTIFNRLGLDRPQRSSWSSCDFLSILWRQQGPAQLAAPASCPLVVPGQGVTIQLHQSAIINTIDPIISGRILRSADLDDMAGQFGLDPSQGLREEAGGEPWSITMAGFHPVVVEFDDQLIRFRIRTTRLDRGDQALDQSASIEATYKPVIQNGAIQMQRVGDVAIDFVGRAQSGLRGVTMRSFLRKKFDSVFKQELFETPLRPTDRLPSNIPLSLVDIQVDDGWLQASLN
jgi:hypothetical protein